MADTKEIIISEEEKAKFKTYTLKEAEAILEISHRSMQNYVKSGAIKSVKIGGLRRISERNLLDFINGD